MSDQTEHAMSHRGRASIWGGDIWKALEATFSDLEHLVTRMRLETEQEARGVQIKAGTRTTKAKWRSTAPQAYDPELDMNVRAWNLIPYVSAIDQEDLQARMEHAARLIPSLKQRFAARDPSPEFLEEWGSFCVSAGAIQLVYFSETDAGSSRKGKSRR